MSSQEFFRLVRYATTGVINTLVTYLVFVAAIWLGASPDVSNFLGFFFGIINSFVFNKLWVFRTSKNWLKEGGVFFLGAAICYLLQWLAFRLFLLYFNEYIAQALGMCVYPILNYMYNRFVTFRHAPMSHTK